MIWQWCETFPDFPPTPGRERALFWRIFPSRSIDFSANILPSMGLKNMTQAVVLSLDILSLRTFCPYWHFVPKDVLCGTLCLQASCIPDVVPLNVWSRKIFCPSFVPVSYVSGYFVWAPVSLPGTYWRDGPIRISTSNTPVAQVCPCSSMQVQRGNRTL